MSAIRARDTDPETSHEAAASVEPKLRQAQTDILGLFRRHSDHRMTDEALVSLANAWLPLDRLQSPSGVRTRRAELVRAGLIRDSGERVKGSTGRRMIVWELDQP